MTEEEKPERYICSKCGIETKHSVLFKHAHLLPIEIFQKNDNGTIHQNAWTIACDHYKFIECKGCETPSAVIEHLVGPPESRTEKDISYFPTRAQRKLPEWVKELPEEIMELFFEVYRALSNNMLRLALMGSRTIFDMLAVSKIGDVGGFKQKLKSLKDQGYISAKQMNVLDSALDAGNAAAHRGYKPDLEILDAVLNIIEHVAGLDYLDRQASEISSKTPSRN